MRPPGGGIPVPTYRVPPQPSILLAILALPSRSARSDINPSTPILPRAGALRRCPSIHPRQCRLAYPSLVRPLAHRNRRTGLLRTITKPAPTGRATCQGVFTRSVQCRAWVLDAETSIEFANQTSDSPAYSRPRRGAQLRSLQLLGCGQIDRLSRWRPGTWSSLAWRCQLSFRKLQS